MRIGDRNDLAGICDYHGALYGVTQSHIAVRFEEDTWIPLGKNIGAKEEMRFCHATAVDGQMFYTYKEERDEEEAVAILYAFDIASGEGKEITTLDGIEIYADEQRRCIFHLSSVKPGVLYSLSLGNDYAVLEEQTDMGILSFLNSYYDASSETFFMTTREGVYRWNWSGAAELCWEGKGISRIIPLSDGKIAVVNASDIIVYNLPGYN